MAEQSETNNPSAPSSIKSGCVAILGGAFLICIAIFLWGAVRGGESSVNRPDSIPMRGTVIILDQRTCASKPMLKIRAGEWETIPLSYEPSNAPCKFRVNVDVPDTLRYTFEIGDLPPIVRTADEMEATDSTGQRFLDVKLSW